MEKYLPFQYHKGTKLINRFLILGEEPCVLEEYDLFDTRIHPKAQACIRDIEENGFGHYPTFEEKHTHGFNQWRCQAERSKVFLYTEVISKTEQDVILSVMAEKWTKVWVNGYCLSIHHWDGAQIRYFTTHLSKGKNKILMEAYLANMGGIFSLQLRDLAFELSNDVRALTQTCDAFPINPLTAIHESVYNTNSPVFRMMFRKNDSSIYRNYRIDIRDSSVGFVKSIDAKIDELVEIDLNELRALSNETLRYEWLSCVFRDRNGKEIITGFSLFLSDFNERASYYSKKALECAKEHSKEIKENLLGRIQRQQIVKAQGNMSAFFWYSHQLKNILAMLDNGTYPIDGNKRPGYQEFYIHSDLDDSTIRIAMRIPNHYDDRRAYPVLIALSTGDYGSFCSVPLEKIMQEPCLCIDATGRGYTGGSYVGEASTLEILEWLKANYSIDEDRIYLLGHSNGGYATFSIAANYPELAAAIYPNVGFPNLETIKNLSNIPTYQTVSSADFVYAGRENAVKKCLQSYANYHQHDFQEMLHIDFVPHLHNKAILNSLLKARRNRYPAQIHFITERNRYLESFWIRLHGITKGEHTAKVKAEIRDNQTICISMRGSQGITVTLPPQIDRNQFRVVLNRKVFEFQNCSDPVIHFVKNRTWEVVNTAPSVDYRKGTGILDVYLNRMRLIVPTNAEGYLRETAEHFAQPYTNGVDPKVYVNYPIYEDSHVPDHILSNNLILLDNNYSNAFAKRFAEKLLIRYDATGYEYKEQRFEGDYLILQVIPNPYDPRLSILVVAMNNKKLARNLLIRKVILPFNANGNHPLWNNMALIFDGKRYSRIYEQEGNIEPVSMKA